MELECAGTDCRFNSRHLIRSPNNDRTRRPGIFRARILRSLKSALVKTSCIVGKAFQEFKQLLARTQIKGFESEAEQMTDEDHGSVVLRSHYVGLRKVYDGWQMPRDPESGAVAGG